MQVWLTALKFFELGIPHQRGTGEDRQLERLRFDKMYFKLKTLLLEVWESIIGLFQRWTGRIRRKEVLAKIRNADIILASPRTRSLSMTALLYRLVLRSRYIHSMLYLGDGKIIHTTARQGVVVSDIPRKIYKKDRYAIFRIPGLNKEKRDKVVEESLKWKHKKLNHAGLITNVPARLLGLKSVLISWERNRIWCSKLVYQSFYAVGVELVPQGKAHMITSEDLAGIPNIKRIQ